MHVPPSFQYCTLKWGQAIVVILFNNRTVYLIVTESGGNGRKGVRGDEGREGGRGLSLILKLTFHEAELVR